MSPQGSGSGWIVDASIALKWFLPEEDEPDHTLARQLIGQPVKATSLSFYEVGNVLSRAPGTSPGLVAECLEVMLQVCGPPVPLEPGDFRTTADLVQEHRITFYDASYVAIAGRLGRRVVSADSDLVDPGLALSLGMALGRS